MFLNPESESGQNRTAHDCAVTASSVLEKKIEKYPPEGCMSVKPSLSRPFKILDRSRLDPNPPTRKMIFAKVKIRVKSGQYLHVLSIESLDLHDLVVYEIGNLRKQRQEYVLK